MTNNSENLIDNVNDDFFSSIYDKFLSEFEFNRQFKFNLNLNETFFYDETYPLIEPDTISQLKSKSTLDFENCTTFYAELNHNMEPIVNIINLINCIIISIGFVFNILNLYVLLNSKLKESPYTYLKFLAASDLGALSIFGFEKLRETAKKLIKFNYSDETFIYVITPLMNIFLSCSMYVTLALTIERFIFVHLPFKAVTFCRKSIARFICTLVSIFSLIRYIYLPFMYEKSQCVPGAWIQKSIKSIDIYEFLVSFAIPYLIILAVNISLIINLNTNYYITEVNNLNSNQKLNSSFIFKYKRSSKPNLLFHRTSNVRELKNNKKLNRTLIMILCVLLICYLPSFLFEESFADVIFGQDKYDQSDSSTRSFQIKAIGYRVSLTCIYINCSCNFLIYCISNKKFKTSFKRLIIKSFLYRRVLYRFLYFLNNRISFKKENGNHKLNKIKTKSRQTDDRYV